MGLSTHEFTKALSSLEEAIDLHDSSSTNPSAQKVFRDGCIQRFEYCIELSWKLSMKLLGSTTVAAKPAIREMARSELITDPNLWIDFIEARNNSSHSYDEEIARSVFLAIQKFLPEAQSLKIKLLNLAK